MKVPKRKRPKFKFLAMAISNNCAFFWEKSIRIEKNINFYSREHQSKILAEKIKEFLE
jgi:hypothetical protein